MSRQHKRIQREAEIITSAMELLEEKSFLDLRMSEVAQAAECSMGAVYSHFSSKEDLLLACAHSVTQDKLFLLRKVLESPLTPLDKIIMVSLLIWLTDCAKPQHYQLRQLAMNPSVWQRASSQRSQVMNNLGEEIQSLTTDVSQQVLAEASGSEASQELAAQFEMGLCGLTVGLYQIKESGFGIFNDEMLEDEGVELHLTNIERYLLGWGVIDGSIRERLLDLRTQALTLIES